MLMMRVRQFSFVEGPRSCAADADDARPVVFSV